MILNGKLKTLFSIIMMVLCITACRSPTPDMQPLRPGDIVVAFGDSLTYGTGAPQNASYPVILAELTGFNVVNEGVPGEETAGGLKRINDVIDKYHPRLVIVCLGGNDLIRKRDQEQIKENLRKLLLRIKNSGTQVVLIAAPSPTLTLSVPDFYSELGAELNIPVDTTSLATLMRDTNLKSDYIHFNAAGYHRFAEAVANLMKKYGVWVPVNQPND